MGQKMKEGDEVRSQRLRLDLEADAQTAGHTIYHSLHGTMPDSELDLIFVHYVYGLVLGALTIVSPQNILANLQDLSAAYISSERIAAVFDMCSAIGDERLESLRGVTEVGRLNGRHLLRASQTQDVSGPIDDLGSACPSVSMPVPLSIPIPAYPARKSRAVDPTFFPLEGELR